MAPTIQNEKDTKERKKEREKERRPESLICRVKYGNTLPDIPFNPKFLVYPHDANRFIEYNPTSLERANKHDILTEHDGGVEVDLVNPDIYNIDHRVKLHPDDERLLEDDAPSSSDANRSRHHNKTVSWLRKTEYISTEIYNKTNTKTDKAESRIGFNIKKMLKEEDVYRDRQSQLDAIERTFQASREPITKHYSKPGVTAVDVLPVMPDFMTWQHPCAQVIFDADPSTKGPSSGEQDVSQAMIRGMVDDTGDQFVAYFLPTEETKQKRKRDADSTIPYTDEEIYEYELTREYNWNVKNKTMSNYEENYFFVFRENGMFYNELETRVRLSKRRKMGAGPGAAAPSTSRTRLLVSHRDFAHEELRAQTTRLDMLAQEEEDVEEEEEETVQEEKVDEDEEEKEDYDEEEKENDDEEGDKEDEEKDMEKDDEEDKAVDDDDDDDEVEVNTKSGKRVASDKSSSLSSTTSSEDEDDGERRTQKTTNAKFVLDSSDSSLSD